MPMIVRDLRDGELRTCLETDRRHTGEAIVGRERAMAAWHRILSSPAFNKSVIEADPPIRGHSIVGFGSSVFVSRDFADAELADPRPGLTDRVIASIADGTPAILDLAQLEIGNASDGLDLVVLTGHYPEDILDASQLPEFAIAMSTAFVAAHLGYRFRRIFNEAVGEEQIGFLSATGTFSIVATFRMEPESVERALMVITREKVDATVGSVIAPLFHYREPMLRLRAPDREVLVAALNERSDDEIAKALNLHLGAVKKRWLSIFARVADTKPEIVPTGLASDGTRGKEKRSRLLAYLREHPEELRPYDWSAVPKAAQARP